MMLEKSERLQQILQKIDGEEYRQSLPHHSQSRWWS
jgi:hypothetical protein